MTANCVAAIVFRTGSGYSGGPYPGNLRKGVNYSVSVHAKAAVAGLVLDLAPEGIALDPSLASPGCAGSRCTLSTEWARHVNSPTRGGKRVVKSSAKCRVSLCFP